MLNYIIVPVFLDTSYLFLDEVQKFLSVPLCRLLLERIDEIKKEIRLIDFHLIHSYKTPCYRLFFEFLHHIAERLNILSSGGFGEYPALPKCLQEKTYQGNEGDRRNFIFYFCESREGGEAHSYFGTGGLY